MQTDLPNHEQPQDDPEGHVGPKTVPGSSQVNPEGHVGPKAASGSSRVKPQGHVGPKAASSGSRVKPQGHVGPKAASGSSRVKPQGHVGPKMDPQGHVGPKITPDSPIGLNPIPHGTNSSFTLTITNLNDTAQDWTWRGSTTTNPVMVNTAPVTLQPGAQQTITVTVDSSGLTQGNSYSPDLIFTFTGLNLSTTITVQFSVS